LKCEKVLEMTKEQRIDAIYNILVQYEKMKTPESEVTLTAYLGYLDRLYIWYLGYGNEEICDFIKGLYKLGDTAEHDSVKRIVFHIITILERE